VCNVSASVLLGLPFSLKSAPSLILSKWHPVDGTQIDTQQMAGKTRKNLLTPTRYLHISWVGQNRMYTPYMTVNLVISLPKTPYLHRIYMVLANPTYHLLSNQCITCKTTELIRNLGTKQLLRQRRQVLIILSF
jgi:hypothetical protein